ncbi:MAG TPA: DUF4019 domain-containing protein [Longimicrobiaceae bacterium]
MDETQMIGDASAAADAWLERLDAGDVDATWEGTSSLFRQLVDQPKWASSYEQVTAIFGRALSRELGTTEYRTSIPGAPDGEYVVLEYMTEFERKKEAVETVVVALDLDGAWRVGGYFVR